MTGKLQRPLNRKEIGICKYEGKRTYVFFINKINYKTMLKKDIISLNFWTTRKQNFSLGKGQRQKDNLYVQFLYDHKVGCIFLNRMYSNNWEGNSAKSDWTTETSPSANQSNGVKSNRNLLGKALEDVWLSFSASRSLFTEKFIMCDLLCTSRRGTNCTMSRTATRPVVDSSLSPLSASNICEKESTPEMINTVNGNGWHKNHCLLRKQVVALAYLHFFKVCSSNPNNHNWQWQICCLNKSVLCFLEICYHSILEFFYNIIRIGKPSTFSYKKKRPQWINPTQIR